MKNRRISWCLVALLLAGFFTIRLATAQKSDKAEVLLQAAQHKQLVEGDLKGAIQIYQQIVASHGNNRAVAAKALVRMGRCYEKLGEAEARKAYERVLRDYADQREQVAVARARLTALTKPVNLTNAPSMVARRIWADSDINFYGMVAPSLDGRYLTFTDRGHLAVRDLTTGKKRRLKSPSHSNEKAEFSIVSPDGKQIAYEWENRDDFDELRIMGFDGSGDHLLYRNEEVKSIRPYAWSPDGTQIVVLARLRDQTWQIALVSVVDGSRRVLKSLDWRYPSKMSLSPDGRYIVYDLPIRPGSPDRDIFLLSADGSREERLIQHPAVDSDPVWAPDGKRILFASDRTGAWSLWGIQIADGKPQGACELVKPDMGQFWPLGFTRDGSYYYGVGTRMEDVFTAEVDPATSKITRPPAPVAERFVGSNLAPVWSPDGLYLAYFSARGTLPFGPRALTIVIHSVKTGQERDLSSKLDHVGPLRWFPDGRSFLACAQDNRNRVSFYRIDAQTGDVSLIRQTASVRRSGPYPFLAELSPDEKAVFYLHHNRDTKYRSLRVYELESGREREVHRVAPHLHFTHFALSRDGRQLAFILHDDATDSRALQIMPASGGQAREVFRPTKPQDISKYNGIAWTPDGRYVLVLRHTGQAGHEHELWRVPTEGGDPQKLGLTMERLRNPSLHPDGRRIVFSAQRLIKEVWVLENFLTELKKDGGSLKH